MRIRLTFQFFVFLILVFSVIIIPSYQKLFHCFTSFIKYHYCLSIFHENDLRKATLSKLSTIPVVSSVEDLIKSNQLYIMIKFYTAGLGNLMFQYAAMRGIAEKYGAQAIVPFSSPLRSVFNLTAQIVSDTVYCSLLTDLRNTVREAQLCCTYEEELVNNLFSQPRQQFELFDGYVQSFRYFSGNENLLRREFTFLPDIVMKAENHLKNILEWHSKISQKGSSSIVFVGVHIRHGDIVTKREHVRHGHKPASIRYLYNALTYFRTKYADPIFVVASDDYNWTKMVLQQYQLDDIYYLPAEEREIDMATLSLCNHTVASTGTFSWWTAFLTNGETLYYKDWPVPNSELDKMIKKSDYFPKQWIGME